MPATGPCCLAHDKHRLALTSELGTVHKQNGERLDCAVARFSRNAGPGSKFAECDASLRLRQHQACAQ